MAKIKVIEVECKNGHLLFGKYRKVKAGNLLKCYIDEIGTDLVGVSNLPTEQDVFCPHCDLRVGRIGLVHGRPAVVVNHGGIKAIRTGVRIRGLTP